MKNPSGEMPFLDHLEELRFRIIYTLGALVVSIGVGVWVVLRFGVIETLQAPALKYFPQGLTTLSLTEPWGIFLTVSIILGVVLASPVIFYQVWAFLSPALMPREKRAIIPTLYLGLVLFLAGAWVSWRWLLPFTIAVLKDPPVGHFNMIVTWDSYFDLVIMLVIAIGVMAELPLVMTILAWIGIIPFRVFRKGRRIAIVINLILGAIISPGTAIVPMVVVTVPLLALYEVGLLGCWLVERRSRKVERAALMGVLLLVMMGGAPRALRAQIGARPPVAQDTTHRKPTVNPATQSARNKRLGIPDTQFVKYPEPDSVMRALLKLPGFQQKTRYVGDSALISATHETMELRGNSSFRINDSTTIEGNYLSFDNNLCQMLSKGTTRIFDPGRTPAVSTDLRFDTCTHRSVLSNAATMMNEFTGGDWFIRGNLALDSSYNRLYMSNGEFTTSTMEIADYHFASPEVKWIAQSVLVARPVVLYVRDVPMMWLPFLFQDTKHGRHSGVLIPKFGINDIVRPNRTYNRQVTDFGYYWAPNDYMDAQARINWYANRNTQLIGALNYNIRNRFVRGSIEYTRMFEDGGGNNTSLRMVHQQDFNASTHLALNIDYSTNPNVVQRNSIDPFQTTQRISSSANFSKVYGWGNISIGGTRSQELGTGSGTMTLPSLSVNPRQIAIGKSVTWSPTFSITNATAFKTVLPVAFSLGPGTIDSLQATGSSRNTTLNFTTPIQIGRWNLPLSISAADQTSEARTQSTQRIPDPANPGDSVTKFTVRNGDYLSTLNWETNIELPRLFQQTWNIVPSAGIANINPGPFMIRLPSSNGKWVQQGKRLQFGVTTSPSVYSFLNVGIGPVMRFRHTLSPSIQVQYSPTATLPSDYAKAYSAKYGNVPIKTPSRLQATVALQQNLMAKLRPAKGDTTTNEANFKRIVLLSISTSGVAYDFEQAKLPGRTGWSNSTLTNQLQSDLLRGFSLSFTHDLFQGMVGTDTAVFKPFLTSVQAGFQLSGQTFKSIAGMLGLGSPTKTGPSTTPNGMAVPDLGNIPGQGFRQPNSFNGLGGGGQGFSATVNYSLTRTRPNAPAVIPIDPITGLPGTVPFAPLVPDQSNVSLSTNFSPTHNWRVSWRTMYNVTAGRFESQSVQLIRDLNEWTATFNFTKAPNGNFQLTFSIVLKGMEQNIKFDYNQTTIRPAVP